MFNIQGSELVFLLLIALLVLGPEKLPDAIRKFTKTYAEFKKVASGFQGELRSVLDEPMRELRGTADAIRQAANLDGEETPSDVLRQAANSDAPASAASESPRPQPAVSEIASRPAAAQQREAALNFGDPRARRREAEAAAAVEAEATAPDLPAEDAAE